MDTQKKITLGLVGNPNCGKTTLLNKLTNSKANVGNYPRVTVAIQSRHLRYGDQEIELVDLPGIYSLTAQTPEEGIGRNYINSEAADIVVNILDASNLERSMFLSTQLLEMRRPTIFVLNMIDEARRNKIKIDTKALSSMLGGPVIEFNALQGEGRAEFLQAVEAMTNNPGQFSPVTIRYDAHLEDAIERVQALIRALHQEKMNDRQCRWLAIKLLEGDDALLRQEQDHAHLLEMVRRERYDLARDHNDSCEMLFADARYGFIHGLLSEAVQRETLPIGYRDFTRRLDAILLHRYFGIPIFVLFLWVMFETTFNLGVYPTSWIENFVAWVSASVDPLLPAGQIHDLIIDGVLAGVGGTIVFLPNIVILFFFMALFSETGYLTRAAFLMDRLMHTFGLHGKALIPLVIGFGCNVPAVMATRTIESDRSRLITILINPFMLCTARLPVFILFAGAFFQEYAGTVVFLMYMSSIVIAMGAAVLLNHLFARNDKEPFVMELPPYRIPTLRAVLIQMVDKALDFLSKISSVILVGSTVIWFLQAYPKDIVWSVNYPEQIATMEALPDSPQKATDLADLRRQQKQEALAKSYLGQIAKTVSPVFAPLDFTWKDTVAILTGFVAKEVVVASYAVIYSQDESSTEESMSLRQALGKSMSPLVAVAFMFFALLYSPCLATIATIQREAGGWKWAGFSVAFSLILAWSLSFTIIQAGHFFV
ncbi:MAG: ferrous iron transport protein B [Magnetococcus sp. DMHC-6]